MLVPLPLLNPGPNHLRGGPTATTAPKDVLAIGSVGVPQGTVPTSLSHPSALFFLACKLSEWAPDVVFSFFCTPKTNGSHTSWPALPNLRIYDVADGLPVGHVSKGRVDDEIDFFLGATPGNYREAVKRVDEIEKVSCVVSDALLWFSREMAEEMGVAWVAFWIAGACALSVHLNTDLIRRKIGTRTEGLNPNSISFLPPALHTIPTAPSPKAHVAVLTFPFGSHPSVPFFLTRKLAEWAPDVAFSFFCIAKTNSYLSSWPTIPNLRIYDLADGVAEGHMLEVSLEDQIELFLRATPGNYREAIKRVNEIDKVGYVLSDALLWFAGHMAEEMGVPWVAFWNGSACSLSAHVNTDLIRQMIWTRPEG
ncbi:hypothetical protein AAC387_Pa03g0186 [Persea americana]